MDGFTTDCMAIRALCYTQIVFVSGGNQGINSMQLGLMCLGLCGHKNKSLQRKKKVMTVFVANWVRTVRLTYFSLAVGN